MVGRKLTEIAVIGIISAISFLLFGAHGILIGDASQTAGELLSIGFYILIISVCSLIFL